MGDSLPEEVNIYLSQLVKRVVNALGDSLLGVYLFGSAGYQAFEPGRSDLDIQAVVKKPLSIEQKQSITQQLSHQVLPCPATKLEFVIYAKDNVDPASRHPTFELNFNTGSTLQEDRISLDPSQEASHWFLLDIAMGRDTGQALYGPAPTEAFAAIPRAWMRDAIADSLEWHRQNEFSSPNSVLNACRGWRFVVTDIFGSKLAGAEWALQQDNCPPVVEQAIAARKTGDTLSPDDVLQLYDVVIEAVRARQLEKAE